MSTQRQGRSWITSHSNAGLSGLGRLVLVATIGEVLLSRLNKVQNNEEECA